MRFGSKVLFEDVTTTFSAGRRYGLTGPNGAGKSTFMKLLTGELPPQKGTVVAPGEARRAAPGSVRLRRLPRHRHGHHGQRAACGPRSRSASVLYAKADDDRRGRHAPRRARGHRRRRGRLHRGERRRDPAAGPRHPGRAARADDGRAAGRPEGARAAGAGAVRPSRRRCCSTSRPTTSTSTRSTGCASSWSATTAR